MKKNILKSLFVGMLCMLAASCQDTEELAQAVDSSKAQVVFSIAMDSPIARSRADQSWGNYNPTDEGTPKDNHIDINQFVVKMEIQGTEYHLSDIIKWKAEGKENVYQFVGVVNGIIEKTDINGAKISVFANMGSDEENLKDEFPYSAVNIPMWGVRTIKLEQNDENRYLAPGTRVDLGSIALLRAMAKIEVALTPEMAADYDLKEVTLNKFNGTGYCLPKGYGAASNTQDMSTTGVFNPLDVDSQASLTFEKETETKDGTTKTSYIVYLPEVANQDNSLKVTVKLLPKNASEQTALETGTFAVMDYSDEASPVAIDIIRNHWYQYEISGFAVSDGEVQVNYSIRKWEDCGIDVGVGYLSLNKDLIEIFNSNEDNDQLKFNSSAPITSIELVDVYKHEQNGRFHIYGANEEKDGKSAYFIDKYGNLKSLQTEKPEIYNNISASWDEDVLNGDIIINSPFIGDISSDKSALQEDSHDNSIRYLEFKVTNAHGLWATFRVMQYPPVVITNEKGYFSYRSDFVTKESPEAGENGIPSHFLNFKGACTIVMNGVNLVHIHEHDNNKHNVSSHDSENFMSNNQQIEYCWGDEDVTIKKYKPYWEEILFGNISYSTDYPVGKILQYKKWKDYMGYANSSENPKLGITYSLEEDDKLYKKHYTGNFSVLFMSRFVDENVSYNNTENSGKALICNMFPGKNGYIAFEGENGLQIIKNIIGNNRMYLIRTTTTSDNYLIGYPIMKDDNGDDTLNPEIGYTFISEKNTKTVSPSFMVASQLGETHHISNEQCIAASAHVGPDIDYFYKLAKKQCKYYVETTYIDENGNGKYDEGEHLEHYDDWRLPTLAEIELIDHYQKKSRAMDVIMEGEQYFCATPGYLSGTIGTEKGTYIRCVRDVKSTDKY